MSPPPGTDLDYFLNPPPGMPGHKESKPVGLSYRLNDAQGAYNGLDTRQTEKLGEARKLVYDVLDEVSSAEERRRKARLDASGSWATSPPAHRKANHPES